MRRIVLISLLFTTAYIGYAGFSLREIASSIAEANADALSDHIDFPLIRASIKEQLAANIMTKAFIDSGNKSDAGSQIGAGLIAAIGPAMINNLVDNFVTPSEIATLLSQQQHASKTGNAEFDFRRFSEHLAILSPTRFRLTDKEGTSVVFALEDWTWKIIDIRASPGTIEKAMRPRDGLAKTPPHPLQDVSTARLTPKGGGWTVEVGFLATDLERMFQETVNERANIDLSPPGVLEAEIGKFVARRVAMHDANGRTCIGKVETAGEDPKNQDSALVVLQFNCAGDFTIYDAGKLLAAQGPRGKQVVTLAGVKNPGETMLGGASPPLDLSYPL